MTRARFIDDGVCPWFYRSDAAMTDWNTFLTNINTELVTNAGWTTPSANLYKSPPDDGGRWIDILFTRISATNLECRVRDHLGRTAITRRIQLAGAGTTIEYYTGKFYCVVQSLVAAPAEIFQSYILEPSPDTELELYATGIFANAMRTSADTDDAGGKQVGNLFSVLESSATYSNVARGAPGESITSNAGVNMIGVSGSCIIEPYMPEVNAAGNVNKFGGQVYQCFLVDNSKALGSDQIIKVESGVTKTFRVLGLTVATNGLRRQAMRKA